MVAASGTTTTEVFGVGLVVPAIIVGLTGDVRRFADKSVGASGSSEVSVLVHGQVDHRGSRLPTGRSSARGRCGSRGRPRRARRRVWQGQPPLHSA